MKRYLLLPLTFFLLGKPEGKSQCAYGFVASQGVYTALDSNSTSINNQTIWDKQSSYTIPMGFNLSTSGSQTSVSSIYINPSTGGFSLPTSYPYTFIFMQTPWKGGLLLDRGYGTVSSSSPISYETTGTAPNRITKVEWKNAGFYYDIVLEPGPTPNNTTKKDSLNFQVWFYENGGKIEYRFGKCDISNNDSYAAFSTTATPGTYTKFLVGNYFLDVKGSFAVPTTACVNNSGIQYGNIINGTPKNGDIWVFELNPATLGLETPIANFNSLELNLSPNPANDVLVVSLNQDASSLKQIVIINSIGEIVKIESKSQLLEKGNSVTLNTSSLKSGIYYISVTDENGNTENRKFIKL